MCCSSGDAHKTIEGLSFVLLLGWGQELCVSYLDLSMSISVVSPARLFYPLRRRKRMVFCKNKESKIINKNPIKNLNLIF